MVFAHRHWFAYVQYIASDPMLHRLQLVGWKKATIMTDEGFLQAFETAQLDAAQFDHDAHVRAAFLMLKDRGFTRAVPTFCAALQALTIRFGVSEKYHETITIAFLALINERCAETPKTSWSTFRHNNPDVFSKDALLKFYTPAQLASPEARKMFQLPRMDTG